LLPLAALDRALSLAVIPGVFVVFCSGLLRSRTFEVLLLFSSSTFVFFASLAE
jgi:hypothetical protein